MEYEKTYYSISRVAKYCDYLIELTSRYDEDNIIFIAKKNIINMYIYLTPLEEYELDNSADVKPDYYLVDKDLLIVGFNKLITDKSKLLIHKDDVSKLIKLIKPEHRYSVKNIDSFDTTIDLTNIFKIFNNKNITDSDLQTIPKKPSKNATIIEKNIYEYYIQSKDGHSVDMFIEFIKNNKDITIDSETRVMSYINARNEKTSMSFNQIEQVIDKYKSGA